jgi:predicted TIM-barrel fold metal-dependent hydrolase
MLRILDCHIHAYPPEVFRDPRAWGEAYGEPWFVECVAPQDRRSIQGWADTDQLLRDMDRAGVEQVVMLGWYWQQQATCEIQNQWFIDWHTAHPDRIHAFATVNPTSGQRGLDNVKRALDAGLLGIGELLPQVQGFSLDDDHFACLAELAIAADVPFNLHVTDPTIDGTPGTVATPLADYIRVAQKFPDAKFILAHWGGGIPFFELNPRLRRQLGNVFYDTSASPLLYDHSVYRRVIDLVGAARILFGTDYPLRVYPRDATPPDFARMVAEIKASGLTAAEFEAIMGDNARKLLKLT